MKKAIVGLVALGAVIALWPLARRTGHKMSEHCGRMAATCKQMMTAQPGSRDEAAGMREHCEQIAARSVAPSEPAGRT
jgi:hypothetical protein